jgi:uncharacterized protein (PEP-CTERM system associated)
MTSIVCRGFALSIGLGLAATMPAYAQEVPTAPEDNGAPLAVAPPSPQYGPGGQYGRRGLDDPRTLNGSGLRGSVSGDVAETFTDNAFEAAQGRKSDLITTPTAGLVLHDDGAYYTADVSYSISGDLYAKNSVLDGLRQNLNALTRANLIPDLLSFDARAFAAPISVDRGAAQTATIRSLPSSATAGNEDTYGYSLGPTLTNAFGTSALSQLSLTTGATFFATPIGPTTAATPAVASALGTAQNTIVNTVSETLSSGPRFTQLLWDVRLSDSETNQTTDDTADRLAQLELKYVLNRFVTVTGTGGYEQITDTLALQRNLSGPVAIAGFHLTPGPRAELTVSGGVRDNLPTYNGDFRYDIGARSRLTASYTDQVTTAEQQLLGNLQGLGVGPQGGLTNVQTGTAFTPQNADNLALANALSRFRSLNVALTLDTERTHYLFSVFHTDQDTETRAAAAILPRQTATGGTVSVQHDLTPLLSTIVDFSYSTGNGDVNAASDRTLRGGASLSYQLTPLMTTTLQFHHLDQQLTGGTAAGTITENAIVLSLHRQF